MSEENEKKRKKLFPLSEFKVRKKFRIRGSGCRKKESFLWTDKSSYRELRARPRKHRC